MKLILDESLIAENRAILQGRIQQLEDENRFLKQWIERLHTRNEQLQLSVMPLFMPRPREAVNPREKKPVDPESIRHWPNYLKARMGAMDREEKNVSSGEKKENGQASGTENSH